MCKALSLLRAPVPDPSPRSGRCLSSGWRRPSDNGSLGPPRCQRVSGLLGTLPAEQRRWLTVLPSISYRSSDSGLGWKGRSSPGAWKRRHGASEPGPVSVITLTHLGSRWLQGLFLVPCRRKGSLLPETGGGANECDLLAISLVLSLFPPVTILSQKPGTCNLLSHARQQKPHPLPPCPSCVDLSLPTSF